MFEEGFSILQTTPWGDIDRSVLWNKTESVPGAYPFLGILPQLTSYVRGLAHLLYLSGQESNGVRGLAQKNPRERREGRRGSVSQPTHNHRGDTSDNIQIDSVGPSLDGRRKLEVKATNSTIATKLPQLSIISSAILLR